MVTICVVCLCVISGNPDDALDGEIEQGLCSPECRDAWDKEQFGKEADDGE
ncbi:hypothetical protein LCGC14_0520360 [marine sediment metagenome]|uniref:Uncharacterized protein n=1 Tax=marine sediment metagenome TaxID=412755 RepID=A0A0F9V6U1_9ZZZZ